MSTVISVIWREKSGNFAECPPCTFRRLVMELVCTFNHHRAVGQHVLSTMIGQFVAIWEWATCHINFYDFSDSRLLLLLESYSTTTASLSISLAIPYTIATGQFYCCGVSCCTQRNIFFVLLLYWFLSTLCLKLIKLKFWLQKRKIYLTFLELPI